MQRLYTFALIVLLLIATSLAYAFGVSGKSAQPVCTSGCERPPVISCAKPEVSQPVDEDLGAGRNAIARMIELY